MRDMAWRAAVIMFLFSIVMNQVVPLSRTRSLGMVVIAFLLLIVGIWGSDPKGREGE
jgi:hypothetical protein